MPSTSISALAARPLTAMSTWGRRRLSSPGGVSLVPGPRPRQDCGLQSPSARPGLAQPPLANEGNSPEAAQRTSFKLRPIYNWILSGAGPHCEVVAVLAKNPAVTAWTPGQRRPQLDSEHSLTRGHAAGRVVADVCGVKAAALLHNQLRTVGANAACCAQLDERLDRRIGRRLLPVGPEDGRQAWVRQDECIPARHGRAGRADLLGCLRWRCTSEWARVRSLDGWMGERHCMTSAAPDGTIAFQRSTACRKRSKTGRVEAHPCMRTSAVPNPSSVRYVS